jgi:excisionase family DNA binding protein
VIVTTHTTHATRVDSGAEIKLLTVDQVADLLQVPKATLYKWSMHGTGPTSYKVGKYLRFSYSEVLLWLAENRNGSAG